MLPANTTTFDCVDIFGRIVGQRWLNYSGMPTTLDKFTDGYGLGSDQQ
jgi:hypothetical protein